MGNPALEGFTAPKFLWMRDEEPDLFDQLRTLLLPKDYVRLHMTGEKATEPSDAAGTLLFDIQQERWSDEMVSALQLDASILPSVRGSASVTGELTASAAESLGLRQGTPVVGGGADNAAAAVGSGVVGQGALQTSISTSGAVDAPIEQPSVDPQMRIHWFSHAIDDTWYLTDGSRPIRRSGLRLVQTRAVCSRCSAAFIRRTDCRGRQRSTGRGWPHVPAVPDRRAHSSRRLERAEPLSVCTRDIAEAISCAP